MPLSNADHKAVLTLIKEQRITNDLLRKILETLMVANVLATDETNIPLRESVQNNIEKNLGRQLNI